MFTALISAIIGGLIAALFVVMGMRGLEDESGDVTINESTAPAPVVHHASGHEPGEYVREVYKRDGPGVVSVDVASDLGPGGGSGFVLDHNGHIITNEHVVEGADEISVQFANGERANAKVVGEDPSTDVAVLKVNVPKDSLKPLTLGDSGAVKVGDPVIAIGNPLNVGISVTTGIVSGLGRPITAPNNYTISGAVQTDAAINPGNSGGPLIDSNGTVVGINAQIASETGASQGVGFAVPINTVKGVVRQLITKGEVEHGYIGVQMVPVGIEELAAYTKLSQNDLTSKYGLPDHGAIVAKVTKGGPAQRAGISGGEKEVEIGGFPVQLGDVITGVGGKRVSTPDDVIRVVNGLRPGDHLTLTVVTPGEKPRKVEIKLGSRPQGA